jgi:hypothetical protein
MDKVWLILDSFPHIYRLIRLSLIWYKNPYWINKHEKIDIKATTIILYIYQLKHTNKKKLKHNHKEKEHSKLESMKREWIRYG